MSTVRCARTTERSRRENQCCIADILPPQHFLYFFPLPHGHGTFRPTFALLCKNDVWSNGRPRRRSADCSSLYSHANSSTRFLGPSSSTRKKRHLPFLSSIAQSLL